MKCIFIGYGQINHSGRLLDRRYQCCMFVNFLRVRECVCCSASSIDDQRNGMKSFA